eukprot:scaffold86_cov338-Pavlova_lutheri.AAC.11
MDTLLGSVGSFGRVQAGTTRGFDDRICRSTPSPWIDLIDSSTIKERGSDFAAFAISNPRAVPGEGAAERSPNGLDTRRTSDTTKATAALARDPRVGSVLHGSVVDELIRFVVELDRERKGRAPIGNTYKGRHVNKETTTRMCHGRLSAHKC